MPLLLIIFERQLIILGNVTRTLLVDARSSQASQILASPTAPTASVIPFDHAP
jgi:hypothetical protein